MDKANKAAVPGMAVQALAGEIIDALLKDEKDGGYDLTAGLFGGEFSTLVRRWAEAEWSAKTAPEAPEFQGIAKHKLDNLKAHGYSITGYAIEKAGTGPHPERGFVTAGGFVGWWRSDEQAAVVCKSEQKRLATLWGFMPQGVSDQALADVMKERDDAEEFGDKLLDLVLGNNRPEWSSAYGTDDALLQVEEKIAAVERAQAVPADPMDWPLPCDVKVGSVTMRKGVPLRALVLRMQMMHDRAAPAGVAVTDERVAFEEDQCVRVGRDLQELSQHENGDYDCDEVQAEWATWQARAALTPAGAWTEPVADGEHLPLPMQYACAGPFPVYSAYQMREYADAHRKLATAPQALPADALEAGQIEAADLWYLQDTRSYVGNDVLWWAKDSNGYTTDISKAHVYTRDDAFRQAAMRGCDRAWPKTYIDGKTRPAVDMQYIDHQAAMAAAQEGGKA